ncbi:hypothetical protein [Pengzhenrongella frigida]|uniref:Uncharacterized protein n=1 Tax=Pengzhenrongella frigida TaxID=1259133 RepID=A0A4Q5N3X1_9MICO|nr:hypothetical protein [Cellulomonas sp. HLT2-17]RYV52942.1 hypothetical protein EUA98_00145 [Cellulomonas sp. HLT2-17]
MTACAALALTLAACGGGSDDPAKGSGAAADAPVGPLDEYFQKMYGGGGEAADDEKMMADSNAQMVKVEELAAACMAEEGFEYLPIDYSASMTQGMSSDELDVEWGTKEFAEQYGYGATTDPGGYQAASMEANADGTDEMVDPNQEAVEAMSETERTAFYAALYGEQTMDPEADPEEMQEYNWETAGCQGKAQHEVYEGGLEADAFAGLQEDITAMYDAVQADPRLADVNAEWASCMADAGFDGLAAVGDGETSIYDEVNVLQEGLYADVDPAVEMTEELNAQMQTDLQDKMAEITPREIKTAVADFGCREDVDFDDVNQKISFELQQEFVDAHKADLDAWLAATTASKS